MNVISKAFLVTILSSSQACLAVIVHCNDDPILGFPYDYATTGTATPSEIVLYDEMYVYGYLTIHPYSEFGMESYPFDGGSHCWDLDNNNTCHYNVDAGWGAVGEGYGVATFGIGTFQTRCIEDYIYFD